MKSRAIILSILFILSSLSPGLLILRRFRCHPLEKLCLAIGLSWLVIYLLATGIYLAHLGDAGHYLVSVACAAGMLFCRKDLVRLWRCRQVRLAVAGFIALLAWNFLLLSQVRNYSGGDWYGDWYEHYQRARYFTDLPPGNVTFRFLDLYQLPARPPMFNLLAAHIMSQAGTGFEYFQVVSLFLNLLVFFPCVLIANMLAPRGRRQLPVLLALFAASPVLTENVTFTWTKMFAAFYVILAVWLYWRGWQKQDPFRIAAAFTSLAAGMLVHYSAGPYVAFFLLHYAIVFWKRKRKAVELFASAAGAGVVLASWFSWSIAIFGWTATFASNTAVSVSRRFSMADTFCRIAFNLFTTLIPHPLHVSRLQFDGILYQFNPTGHLRDYWFLTYQNALLPGMGLLGGLLVIYLLWRKPDATRLFFVIFCTLTGIAVVGTRDSSGVAHVCLQPLTMLGITFLAANFRTLPPWLRRTAALFVVVDFCLGVLLNFHVQAIYINPQIIGGTSLFPLTAELPSRRALANEMLHNFANLQFLGDHFAAFQPAMEIITIIGFALFLFPLAQATTSGICRKPAPFFWILIAAFVFGSAAVLHPFPPVGPSSDIEEQRAEQEYQRGEIDPAIEDFRKACLRDSTDVRARYLLNVTLMETGHAVPDANPDN